MNILKERMLDVVDLLCRERRWRSAEIVLCELEEEILKV